MESDLPLEYVRRTGEWPNGGGDMTVHVTQNFSSSVDLNDPAIWRRAARQIKNALNQESLNSRARR